MAVHTSYTQLLGTPFSIIVTLHEIYTPKVLGYFT